MLKYFIRNVFAVGYFITATIVSVMFFSGSMLQERLQGEYICPDTFFIEAGEESFIKVHKDYIIIDGQHYFKR